MKKGISVCTVVRNGLINGYPFWESLNSCLPFADEIVISEGFSDDATLKVLRKFAKQHPKKVNLFQDSWTNRKSPYGEIIATMSTRAMKHCKHEWIYYLQADEVVHEENHQFLKDLASGKLGVYNSVVFQFAHFIGSWKPLPRGGAAYFEAIRMVRNRPDIKLIGDAWTFGGRIKPLFSSDLVPKPIYHLGWVFPKNIDQKNLQQAKIYPNLPGYQEKAKVARANVRAGYTSKKGLPPEPDFNDYPKGVHRLIGMFEYKLPDGVL